MKVWLAGALAGVAFLAAENVHGETFGVSLTPSSELPSFGDPRGSGFGLVTLDGTTISYTFYVQGIQAPTSAYLHAGSPFVATPPVASFGFFTSSPGFADGVASGSVMTTREIADQIHADPSAFYVNLQNADYPAGALRGQLSAYPTRVTVFPTVVKARGLNNSNFVTDLSLLNRVSGETAAAATVTLDFYASSESGLSAPTASKTLTVAPGEQVVLKDLLATAFGVSGDGALRVTAARNVAVTARVFNDQQASGAGTTGLLVLGSEVSEAAPSGVLPLLSSASPGDTASGLGYRTNIGYFNPYAGPAAVTFTALRTSDGRALGSVTRTIPGGSRVQQPVFDLISTVPESDRKQDDYYVTFTASKGSALFVYAVVVDNRTGDGIYIKATPSTGIEPAPAALGSFTGTWKGGGKGFTLTWHLTQQGELLTGYLDLMAEGNFNGREYLYGTVSGATLKMHGLGLQGDTTRTCLDVVVFDVVSTDSKTVTGTYEETGTCFPGDAGTVQLTKQ